ncbi:hypothetical protein DM02DRAFT_128461 [Periconia macrospinosa]|uniref:Uncharacterized protein n=1 Tax=Periconia macrospinosa TaxID=97972 RepID=A0A2V1DDZ4_9PLEO|nr:hypothetical protein DM02DRAFT_128461 [Periconia macrospinosa]
MYSSTVLAISLLTAYASAESEVLWLKPQQMALVKLATPGYPLWVMDKEKPDVPVVYQHNGEYYSQTNDPSAVLLNLSMSANNHTLYINGQAILPLEDSNRPPQITTHQVHADTSVKILRTYAASGLLRGELGWDELQHRDFLELDYDRLVEADPETGPYFSHKPTLRFRIMGLGAYTTNEVLDVARQSVLHVTLNDTHGKISNHPKRSYAITNIEIKSIKNSYGGMHKGLEEDTDKECTIRSWACPDTGLYTPMAPYYRFIWRSKFDQFGRIGSTRHTIMQKVSQLQDIVGSKGLKRYITALVAGLIAVVAWNTYKKRMGSEGERKARKAALRSLEVKAARNRGEIVYADDDEDDEWIEAHSKDVVMELTDQEARQLSYIIPDQ